jgi:hypothetical protein
VNKKDKENQERTKMKHNLRNMPVLLTLAVVCSLTPTRALAHCDTMDGPVVQAARTALEQKDVTPVLQWIQPEAEAELKAAFIRTLVVRAQSKEARELADQLFFETLVRVHRAGEGAPYTGLRPAGTKVEPIIAASDRALESGSADALTKAVAEEVTAGIRKRFATALQKRQHAAHSVEAGREYVAAYVEYVHYVEGLQKAAHGAAGHHGEAPVPSQPATSEHGHP